MIRSSACPQRHADPLGRRAMTPVVWPANRPRHEDHDSTYRGVVAMMARSRRWRVPALLSPICPTPCIARCVRAAVRKLKCGIFRKTRSSRSSVSAWGVRWRAGPGAGSDGGRRRGAREHARRNACRTPESGQGVCLDHPGHGRAFPRRWARWRRNLGPRILCIMRTVTQRLARWGREFRHSHSAYNTYCYANWNH
jgi:hypothetical protein